MDINFQKKQIYLIGVLSLFFSILYFDYLKTDPVLKRDDTLLIHPLTTITSFSNYLEQVQSNAILDVQPVRDLSFFINIKILQFTGLSTFHLTNLIIFLLLIFLFSNLLETLNFSPHAIMLSILIFSLHPVMVSSVGWISARKHSLALFFILISLLSFLKKRSITPLTIIFAALSFFTHQIFILFPFWILIYARIKKINLSFKSLILLFILAGLALFLGTYKTFYLEMGNVTYQSYGLINNISRYILSIGRSFTQLIFPLSIAGDYYQGNIYNTIGIPLVILIPYILYKSRNRIDSFLWLALAGSAHILTSITFINDTYLYLPLICLIISINFFLKEYSLNLDLKWKNSIGGFLVFLLSLKTIHVSKMWESDLRLWHYSHESEKSPYSAILLGSHLMKHDRKTALDLIVWGAKNYHLEEHLQILLYFLHTIYTSPLTIHEKIKILEDCAIDNEIYSSYLGLAYLEGDWNQMNKGIEILRRYLKSENNYTKVSEGFKIIASIKYLCGNIPEKKYVCEKLNISF